MSLLDHFKQAIVNNQEQEALAILNAIEPFDYKKIFIGLMPLSHFVNQFPEMRKKLEELQARFLKVKKDQAIIKKGIAAVTKFYTSTGFILEDISTEVKEIKVLNTSIEENKPQISSVPTKKIADIRDKELVASLKLFLGLKDEDDINKHIPIPKEISACYSKFELKKYKQLSQFGQLQFPAISVFVALYTYLLRGALQTVWNQAKEESASDSENELESSSASEVKEEPMNEIEEALNKVSDLVYKLVENDAEFSQLLIPSENIYYPMSGIPIRLLDEKSIKSAYFYCPLYLLSTVLLKMDNKRPQNRPGSLFWCLEPLLLTSPEQSLIPLQKALRLNSLKYATVQDKIFHDHPDCFTRMLSYPGRPLQLSLAPESRAEILSSLLLTRTPYRNINKPNEFRVGSSIPEAGFLLTGADIINNLVNLYNNPSKYDGRDSTPQIILLSSPITQLDATCKVTGATLFVYWIALKDSLKGTELPGEIYARFQKELLQFAFENDCYKSDSKDNETNLQKLEKLKAKLEQFIPQYKKKIIGKKPEITDNDDLYRSEKINLFSKLEEAYSLASNNFDDFLKGFINRIEKNYHAKCLNELEFDLLDEIIRDFDLSQSITTVQNGNSPFYVSYNNLEIGEISYCLLMNKEIRDQELKTLGEVKRGWYSSNLGALDLLLKLPYDYNDLLDSNIRTYLDPVHSGEFLYFPLAMTLSKDHLLEQIPKVGNKPKESILLGNLSRHFKNICMPEENIITSNHAFIAFALFQKMTELSSLFVAEFCQKTKLLPLRVTNIPVWNAQYEQFLSEKIFSNEFSRGFSYYKRHFLHSAHQFLKEQECFTAAAMSLYSKLTGVLILQILNLADPHVDCGRKELHKMILAKIGRIKPLKGKVKEAAEKPDTEMVVKSTADADKCAEPAFKRFRVGVFFNQKQGEFKASNSPQNVPKR